VFLPCHDKGLSEHDFRPASRAACARGIDEKVDNTDLSTARECVALTAFGTSSTARTILSPLIVPDLFEQRIASSFK
jgi:hypothetical protein